MKAKTFLYLIVMVSIGIFGACGSRTGDQHLSASDTTAVQAQGIILENDTLAAIFAHYIALKDALVASDAKLSGEAADRLSESLKPIHGCENTAVLAQEIANSTDLTLQRSAFSTISTDLIALFQHAPLHAGEIYVIHCPMYNNKAGADWLSTSSAIKNPYFGDEMLTCGTVTQEIK
ncbi:DUF3347 domain-containing protein [Olivibacter ginsenosidimutans]|uniref:DUF3347 domain-containing protein n=1 Tax=Olivibacter ginsenosidimutans TaxID=1176537 RepID=A0ABP9AXI7_9SPHI